MTRYVAALASLILTLAAGGVSAQSFESDVSPLVEASCLRCHGDRTVTPLNLAHLGFDLTDRENFHAWEKVYERLKKGEMPPSAAPQPDAEVVKTALGSLKRALVEANLTARGEQRTQLRRLTRLEYSYTLHDLLGIDEEIATELSLTVPAEADSGGFDTVAAHQSMSPLHVRSYLAAADRALDVALPVGPPPPVESFEVHYAESESMYRNSQGQQAGAGVVLQLDDAYATFLSGASTYCCILHSESQGFAVPYPGRYRVTITAYPYQADTPVTLTLYRGRMSGLAASLDRMLGAFDLVGDEPRTVEFTPFLRPGDLVSPSLADNDAPPGDNPGRYSRPGRNVRDYKGEGIALKTMTIDGPLLENDMWPPPSTRELLTGVEFDEDGEIRLTKDPYAHIVDIVAAFAPRAFRRALNEDELEAYAGLARPLLDDAKTERFAKDFTGQAFRLYELRATAPDPGLYPEFDDGLARAMEAETQLFLAELIADDLSVGSLIDADFTFLNRRLAEHYDVSGVDGQQMRKVVLPADSPRGGLLTQASIHKITANGTTTSPIPRGNFVLTNLLGQPAPPPPSAVDIPEPDTRGTTTIREQLDAHRSSPVCASCHRVIDPPGFALESFDPIGGFRTNYRTSGGEIDVGDGRTKPAPYTEGAPVDPSGVTPEGDAFSDIEEYKQFLLQEEVDQVARHVASQLLVFSTGGEIEFADRDTVEQIVEEGRNEGHPVRAMVHRVVQSHLFRSR